MWTINNEAISIADQAVSISHSMGSHSTLSIGVTAEYHHLHSRWNLDDEVTLRKDGVIVFSGRVTSLPRSATGSSEGMSYEVSGPWWDMDNIVDLRLVKYRPHTPIWRHTGVVIRDILEYAISRGARMQIGTIEKGMEWPYNESQDQPCAGVIRDMLRLTPSYVAWIDFSTEIPTFHYRQHSALGRRVFDLAGGNVTAHSISEVTTDPKGIRIAYEFDVDGDAVGVTSNNYESSGSSVYHRVDEAGNTDGLGVDALTVSWPKGVVLPVGIADAYMAQYQRQRYQGALELKSHDAAISIKVGETISFLGGAPVWAGINEIVQEVTHDLAAGVTSITYGPSAQLSVQDLLARIKDAQRGFEVISTTKPNDSDDSGGGGGGGGGGEDEDEFSSLHSFAVQKIGSSWVIHPGSFFWSAVSWTSLLEAGANEHGTPSLTTRKADGTHDLQEALGMTTKVKIEDMKASKFGVQFSTDHLGEVQWAQLQWEDDTPERNDFNPIAESVSVGDYFLPIIEFKNSDAGDGFEIKETFRRSDIYWQGNSYVASESTAPFTPPEPTEKPS